MKISPTQLAKYRQCARIIGFEYVEGIKAPPSPKQQFGSRVHKHLEDWLRHSIMPPDTPEGLTARQGIGRGWLPDPSPYLLVEHEWLFDVGRDLEASGFADCIDPLGDRPLVIDHKTTSDLRWAKSPVELATDPQALLYAAWAMLKYRAPVVNIRWIYYAARNREPRTPSGCKPVSGEFRANAPEFLAAFAAVLADARAVQSIRTVGVEGLNLKPSPASCGMFGGCFYRDRCNLSGGDRLVAHFEKWS